jgi:hypothetical protein
VSLLAQRLREPIERHLISEDLSYKLPSFPNLLSKPESIGIDVSVRGGDLKVAFVNNNKPCIRQKPQALVGGHFLSKM